MSKGYNKFAGKDGVNFQRKKAKGSVSPVKREDVIGRNEPCICGSGKKYKKCCINK